MSSKKMDTRFSSTFRWFCSLCCDRGICGKIRNSIGLIFCYLGGRWTFIEPFWNRKIDIYSAKDISTWESKTTIFNFEIWSLGIDFGICHVISIESATNYGMS